MSSLLRSGSFVKQAGPLNIATTILSGLGRAATSVAVKPTTHLMKSIAKRLPGFTAQHNSAGKIIHDTVGKTGLANRFWRLGNRLEKVHNAVDRSYKTGLKALENSGSKWLGVAKYTPLVGSTYLGVAHPLASLSGNEDAWWAKPSDWAWKVNPWSLAGEGAANLAMKGYNKVQDIAANKAYEASMQTAYGIARELANRSRAEHLYGVWNPEGYAQKLLEGSVSKINDTFAQQMSERGIPDWRPETIIGSWNSKN